MDDTNKVANSVAEPNETDRDTNFDRRGLLKAVVGSAVAIGAVAAGAGTAEARSICKDTCEKTNPMTLDQFNRLPVDPGVKQLLSQFNGGSFMDCHEQVRDQTGIWITDLVPVFQRLDAALVLKPLHKELAP